MGSATKRINEIFEQLKADASADTDLVVLELQAIKAYLNELADGQPVPEPKEWQHQP